MGQNLKLVFIESRPTLVSSYIFKAMLTSVTKPAAVCRQLRDLSRKICVTSHPIFVSRKLEQDRKQKEIKPNIVNRQCIVYTFACDLCDADYVGFTARHLHQRIAEHKYSSIGDKNLLNEAQFCVLKKCHRKFDCLVYEMLFIQELKPSLNTQRDSISAKLFV